MNDGEKIVYAGLAGAAVIILVAPSVLLLLGGLGIAHIVHNEYVRKQTDHTNSD